MNKLIMCLALILLTGCASTDRLCSPYPTCSYWNTRDKAPANANYGTLPLTYKEDISNWAEIALKDGPSSRYKYGNSAKSFIAQVRPLKPIKGIMLSVLINSKNSYGGYSGYTPYSCFWLADGSFYACTEGSTPRDWILVDNANNDWLTNY